MVAYADLIILLNLLFDCLLLLVTAIILKQSTTMLRVILSAFIGAIPVISVLFSTWTEVNSLPGKLIISICMISIAFPRGTIKQFMMRLFTFYFVTFFTGGTIIALHNMFGSQLPLLTSDVMIGDRISWIFVCIAFPISLYYVNKHVGKLQFLKLKQDHVVKVEIIINGITIEAKGLIDTGNSLTDPLTGTPVMIIPKDLLLPFLPERIWSLLEKRSFYNSDDPYDEWTTKIHFVPFKVVGNEKGLLPCLRADEVYIYMNNRKTKVSKVLIGVNENKLHHAGEYDCILHPKMVTKNMVPA